MIDLNRNIEVKSPETNMESKDAYLEKEINRLPKQIGEGNELNGLPDEIGENIRLIEASFLTKEKIQEIKEETGWSEKIIGYIRSIDEYEQVYKNAGLREEIINGRLCLIKDIDLDYFDAETGMTNRQRMALGRSPIDSKTGEKIELHHMGQSFDSPLAELCENSEHGGKCDKVLHDKKYESWRTDAELKNQYNNIDRPNHWKTRLDKSVVK